MKNVYKNIFRICCNCQQNIFPVKKYTNNILVSNCIFFFPFCNACNCNYTCICPLYVWISRPLPLLPPAAGNRLLLLGLAAGPLPGITPLLLLLLLLMMMLMMMVMMRMMTTTLLATHVRGVQPAGRVDPVRGGPRGRVEPAGGRPGIAQHHRVRIP